MQFLTRDKHEPAHEPKFIMNWAQFMIHQPWFVPACLLQTGCKPTFFLQRFMQSGGAICGSDVLVPINHLTRQQQCNSSNELLTWWQHNLQNPFKGNVLRESLTGSLITKVRVSSRFLRLPQTFMNLHFPRPCLLQFITHLFFCPSYSSLSIFSSSFLIFVHWFCSSA